MSNILKNRANSTKLSAFLDSATLNYPKNFLTYGAFWIFFFLWLFLGRKFSTPWPLSLLKRPHIMVESGCLTIVWMNLVSYRLALTGLFTFHWHPVMQWNFDSSFHITSDWSSTVWCSFFLVNAGLCFIILNIRSNFLVAGDQVGSCRLFCWRFWMSFLESCGWHSWILEHLSSQKLISHRCGLPWLPWDELSWWNIKGWRDSSIRLEPYHCCCATFTTSNFH